MTESKKLNLASFFFQIQINIFIIPSTGQYLSHYVKHPLVWPIKKAPLPPCLPKGRPVTWMSSPQFNLYSALLVGWCTSQTPYAKLFTNWQLSPLKDNAQHNVPPPQTCQAGLLKGNSLSVWPLERKKLSWHFSQGWWIIGLVVESKSFVLFSLSSLTEQDFFSKLMDGCLSYLRLFVEVAHQVAAFTK